MKPTHFRHTLMASTLISGMMLGSVAAAQEAAQEEDAPVPVGQVERDEVARMGTVQVTGSRILNPNLVAASPVTTVGAEEFSLTGTTRVEDLLNTLPQLSPSFDSFTVNPTTGFATADLRGLGTSRTLVLVNGQRLQPGGIRSEAPDLNQIPAAMIERVEVLTGGASAVYGSDALAGVVNFVMNRNFEGFAANFGISGYQHENSGNRVSELAAARGFSSPKGNSGIDGKTYSFDIAMGSSFDGGRGSASGYITYRTNEELLQGARDYSSCALSAAGTVCGGSSTAPRPNFFIIHPDLVGFANLGNDGVWRPGVGELYNYAPINHYQRPDERYTAGVFANYEINRHFRPYMDVMFANTNTSVQIAESGTFFVNFLELECSNPLLDTACANLGLNPAEPVGVYVGKRNNEGGPRVSDIESTSFRLVSGLEGDITDSWVYNMSLMYGRNTSNETNRNDFLTSRLEDALLQCPPGSFSGCVPYNVWAPGGVTPEAAAALGGTGMRQGATELTTFNAYASGDTGFSLPTASENISLVGGLEWRQSTYEVRSDTNMAEGNFTGLGGPRRPISGGFNVIELFAEALVPLVDGLNLELGYRTSDYSNSGAVDTYKIAASWQAVDAFRVRGGYNRAIRAPNVNEAFADQQIALFGGDDPCSGTSPVASLAQCQASGVTAAQYGSIQASPASQYNQFIGGNPDLTPEVAETYTLGAVLTPFENFSATIDYYLIEIEDRIGTVGANNVVNGCVLNGVTSLCSLIRRNPVTGDLWLGSSLQTSGYVTNLSSNFGNLTWEGVDLALNYGVGILGGNIGANFVGSYAIAQELDPLPGINDAARYDCAGIINTTCQTPEWRHTMRLTYDRGSWWSATARWRYVGEMDYKNNNGTPATVDTILVDNGNKLSAVNYFDIAGTFDLLSNTTLTMGVNNVFDETPPIVGSTLALNANSPGGYDQNGRYLFARIGVRF